eukprot:XP_001699057.1 predicted protein [Chlamydomonas reinhardtii]
MYYATLPPKPPSTPLSPSPSNKLQEVRRILQQEPLAAQRRQSCPAHPDTHLLSSASARVSTDFAPEVTAPGHPVYVVRRAYRSSLDGSQPSSANSTAPGDEAPPGAWAHTNGAQSHSGWAATSSVGRAPSAGPSPLPSRRALHPRSGSCTPTVGASAPGSPLLPPPPPNAAGGLGQVPLAKVPGTASLPKPPPQEGVHLHSCSPGGESEASSPQHGGVGAGGGAGGSMGGAAMMATRPPRPSRFKSSNGLLVSSIAPPPALASSPLHSAASGPLLGGHGQGQGGHGRGSATCGGGFTTVSQSTSAAVSPPHTPRGRGSGNGDWPPPVTAGSGAQGSTAPSCHSHMGSPFGDARHDGDPESLPSPFSELPTSSQIFSSLLRAGSAGASGRGPTRLFAHDPDGLPISNTAPRGPMAISDTGAATGGLMGQASGALRSSKSGAGPPPGLGLVSGHLLCRVLLFLYYSAVLVAEVDAWRNHSIRQSASARLRRLEEEEEEEGFWHYGARSGPQRGAGSSGLLSSIQGWIRTALAVLDPGGTGPLAAAFPLAHAALAVPCLLALLGGVWWEPAALVLGGRLLWDLACRHGWGLLMFYKGESAQLMRMKELAVLAIPPPRAPHGRSIGVPALEAGLGLMAPLFLYYGCVQDAGGVGGALRELVGDTYRWVPPGDGSLNTFWLPSQFAMALPYFTGMGPQWLAVALAGAVGMEGLLCWRFWARGGMLWTYAFYVGRHFLANAVIAGGVLLSLPAAQVQAPARSAALWRRKHKTT